jgi:hypothetical protein
LLLFFREVHGAEKISIRVRLLRFRRGWRLFAFLRLFAWWLLLARFVTAWLGTLRRLGTLRLIMRRRLLPLRLDAAQCAAKFLKLAFVGDFLPLGDFDEFQNFVHLVVQFLQRRGDEHRVFDGLTDGRGRGGTKIGGLDPLALRRRNARRRLWRANVAAFIPTLLFAARLARRFRRRRGFGCRLRFVGFGGRRVFLRTETFRHIGMWLAKTAGGFGLVFRVLGVFRCFSRWRGGFNCFGRGRNFFGVGRTGFCRYGPRAATTATATTATATVAAGRTARRGRVQIGLFVRHKIVR